MEHGESPGLEDPPCQQGEPTATLVQTQDAACAVEVARKMTKAMLR